MIISERIVNRTTSAQGVGQGHMLHTCAEYLPTKVRIITSVYIVVAQTTPQVIAPVNLMTTERNPGLHQGIFTVMDHTMEQTPKIWEYPEEIHENLHILRLAHTENSTNYIPPGQQVQTNNPFPYRDYRYDLNGAGHQ